MSLSRKHYEAIADIINRNSKTSPGTIADRLADYFETESPNFDREKFMTAAGFPEAPKHDLVAMMYDFGLDVYGNKTCHITVRDAETREIVFVTKRRRQSGYSEHCADHVMGHFNADVVHHEEDTNGMITAYLKVRS